MKFNSRKFFELAKENNFEAADISIHKESALSFSVFHGEIDSYTDHNSESLSARGIIKGKFGGVTTEVIDKSTPEFLINKIKDAASYIENDDPCIIYKGSKKYHNKNLYNKAIFEKPIKEKIDLVLEIEKRLYAYDKRINEVASVGYSESSSSHILENTYGLKLKSKTSSFSLFAEITAKVGEEVRTGFELVEFLSFDEFNIDQFVKNTAESALKKLGATQCKSKNYPVILNQDAASILLRAYLGSASAEEVQKKSSLFIGKLHQPVASKKLTVIENPLEKNVFFASYDGEGVATYKKTIINKGILETYLYTLESAAKDGVEPTGNGSRTTSKASTTLGYSIVKPGRKGEDELISSIKEGVYIDDLSGLHAGMNAKSGNFSLQAEGFMIRDGKLAEPLTLITVAGNLVDMFMNIKDIANNSKLVHGTSMSCPSIKIKKLSISGK